MNFLVNYWSQITVLIGVVGYLLKSVFDYRIKNKELRNKFFYELKAQKIIELYSKIVEIQMIIDRRIGGTNFENNVYKHRMELDKYYWESKFYFNEITHHYLDAFIKGLMAFEHKQNLNDYPESEDNFRLITNALLKEFKNEIF